MINPVEELKKMVVMQTEVTEQALIELRAQKAVIAYLLNTYCQSSVTVSVEKINDLQDKEPVIVEVLPAGMIRISTY